METLLQSIPFWLVVLLAIVAAGLALSALVAVLLFVFKLGVVVYEARKPPHLDAGDYRLAQGHEVRPEAEPSAISRQPSAISKRD